MPPALLDATGFGIVADLLGSRKSGFERRSDGTAALLYAHADQCR